MPSQNVTKLLEPLKQTNVSGFSAEEFTIFSALSPDELLDLAMARTNGRSILHRLVISGDQLSQNLNSKFSDAVDIFFLKLKNLPQGVKEADCAKISNKFLGNECLTYAKMLISSAEKVGLKYVLCNETTLATHLDSQDYDVRIQRLKEIGADIPAPDVIREKSTKRKKEKQTKNEKVNPTKIEEKNHKKQSSTSKKVKAKKVNKINFLEEDNKLKEENLKLTQENELLKATIAQFKNSTDPSMKIIEHQRETISSLEAELRKLKTEANKAQNSHFATLNNNADLIIRLKTATEEAEHQTKKVKEIKAEFAELTNLRAIDSKENAETKRTLEQITAQLEESRTARQKLQISKINLELSLESANQRLSTLPEIIKSLQNVVDKPREVGPSNLSALNNFGVFSSSPTATANTNNINSNSGNKRKPEESDENPRGGKLRKHDESDISKGKLVVAPNS